jgi:hypothetical protein
MTPSLRGWEAFPTPGPSPTLGSLGPSHHRRYKSRVSLRGPFCALGVSGIPFATSLTTFELPSYAAEFAHVLAEAPSPAPIRTRPFNKQVLDFLDIKAEQGEYNDRLSI